MFRSRLLLTAVLILVVLAASGMAWQWSRSGALAGSPTVIIHEVSRGNLAVTVTERGTLASSRVTEIKVQVENAGFDQTGVSGTQIIDMVANGSAVAKGDVLVKLDETVVQKRLRTQTLAFRRAEITHQNAVEDYERQKDDNAATLLNAQRELDTALLEQRMYDDGKEGTYKLQLEELQLKIQESRSEIAGAQAARAMQQNQLAGIRRLYKMGFRGKADVDQSRYEYLQSQDTLVRASNTLSTALASLRKFEVYDHPMQQMKLQTGVAAARLALSQMERDNAKALHDAKSAKETAEEQLKQDRELLAQAKAQLARCTITAPHAGMAVYSSKGLEPVQVGTVANFRQTVLTLQDLGEMQVSTTVHESALAQVREGLTATITVDAFPDRTFRGKVKSVAVLPKQDEFFESETKLYETIVSIQDQVNGLRPGMNAVVRIHVANVKDAVLVPVQAVIQVKQRTWCYKQTAGGPQPQEVEVGQSNDKFVEIRTGIAAGDSIVLNALDLVDRDLASQAAAPGPQAGTVDAGNGEQDKPRSGGGDGTDLGIDLDGEGLGGDDPLGGDGMLPPLSDEDKKLFQEFGIDPDDPDAGSGEGLDLPPELDSPLELPSVPGDGEAGDATEAN